jgi:GAF domain-containing protein
MGHRKEISATAGEGAQNNCSESFEALLLEISALFINIPIDTIDSVIEDAQRRICEYLGLDLSSLWQWSEKDPRIMTITHLFSRPDGPERPENIDASISFPWVFNRVLGGEMMIFSNRDLPVEAAAVDLASRSLYGVPLNPILGILTFETLGRERFWDDSEVQRLTLVATIFPLRVGDEPILGILTFETLGRERFWDDSEVQRLQAPAGTAKSTRQRGTAQPGGGIGRRRALGV